jgi:hypothetical protein
MKDYFDLRAELNSKQSEALIRSFNAVGKAWSVDLNIPDPAIFDKMPVDAGARLVTDALLEVVEEEKEAAKRDFIDAGEAFVRAAMDRRDELEDLIFGDARKLPLTDRVSISEQSPDRLLQLLEQAWDSNDDELLSLVFLGAHVGDHPEVKGKILDLDEKLGELYAEWTEIPANEVLAAQGDPEKYDILSASHEVDMGELLNEARNYTRTLTA